MTQRRLFSRSVTIVRHALLARANWAPGAACVLYRTLYSKGMTSGPLTEVRDNLSEVIDNVMATGDAYEITRHGKRAAVLLAADDYDALLETLNVLSDSDTMDALAEAEVDIAEGRIDADDELGD